MTGTSHNYNVREYCDGAMNVHLLEGKIVSGVHLPDAATRHWDEFNSRSVAGPLFDVSVTLPQPLFGTVLNDNFYLQANDLTHSSPVPLKLYTLPYWSNPPFLIFGIRALWRSGLSVRAPECQKLKWWVKPVWRRTLRTAAIWNSWRWRVYGRLVLHTVRYLYNYCY